MHQYFKLVALHDQDWLVGELQEGRVRYGWSWPGSNLRELREKRNRNEDERIAWRYTQFLIERLRPGNRLVLQFDQPLRRFWLAEVLDEGYEFDPELLEDFNHIIHVQPLTEIGIPINAQYIPASLKHDLTKRGHYYEIYPEESITCLEQMVEERPWEFAHPEEHRREEDEFDDFRRRMFHETVAGIHTQWQAHAFEIFCEHLCQSIDYIEVHSRQDTGQGWDLIIRILDPITGSILLDGVPVQCKNYHGDVVDNRPINDLVRCIHNSGGSTAYLFIIGDLTKEFRQELEKAQDSLTEELGRQITFRIVEQEMIAELYLNMLVKEG